MASTALQENKASIDMSGTDLNISVSTTQYDDMDQLRWRPAVDLEPSNPCTLLTGLLRRSQPSQVLVGQALHQPPPANDILYFSAGRKIGS